MCSFVGKRLKRLIAVVVLALIAIFVNHHFRHADTMFLITEPPESISVISKCTINTFEPLYESSPLVEFRSDSRIPNVIHQLWKTSDVGTYSTEIEASLDSWKNIFEPLNYTIKLWTDDDILRLVKAKYPWMLTTYETYPQDIQRADIARLLVVLAEGGIYADLDVYPTSPPQIQCLQQLGLEALFASTVSTLGLSNHFFMAERGSPFLQWVLHEAKERSVTSQHIFLPYIQVFWSTGPTMVTEAFRKYARLYSTFGHDVGVLENEYSKVVISHAAGRSWHRLDGQVLNFIGDHL